MGALIDFQSKAGETALLISLRNNNTKLYHLLLSQGANPNMTWNGLYPLSVLAWDGNIAMAKMLISETKPNINSYNENGSTPLICAAIGGRSAMVQFLIENGADINVATSRPIDLEVPQKGFVFYKKYVLFPKGSTALNFSETMGNVPMANLIRDLGGICYHRVEYKEVSQYW
jgi:ankyrin repeat protein